MSEPQKPTKHPMVDISMEGDSVYLGSPTEMPSFLTPDEAVALGYALFEHGLYLKGRMK